MSLLPGIYEMGVKRPDGSWLQRAATVASDSITMIELGMEARTSVAVLVECRAEAPGIELWSVSIHLTERQEEVLRFLAEGYSMKEIGQALHASDVVLPQGAELLSSPEDVVVQCTEAVEMEVEEGEAGAAEPEVIGRKAEDEEGED